MLDLKLTLALVTVSLVGCAPSFEKSRTPSGDFCTDMPVVPSGTSVDKPFHRLKSVASSVKCTTEAERLESLRKEGCKLRADAIIEAANESTRAPDGIGYITRASGTAIVWVTAPTGPTPISSSAPPATVEKKNDVKPAATPAPAPATAPDDEGKSEEPPPPPPESPKKKKK
jgi:hypothetical protein